jgi:hypothetical protein
VLIIAPILWTNSVVLSAENASRQLRGTVMIIQWQAVSTSSQAVVMGRPAPRSKATSSADTPNRFSSSLSCCRPDRCIFSDLRTNIFRGTGYNRAELRHNVGRRPFSFLHH